MFRIGGLSKNVIYERKIIQDLILCILFFGTFCSKPFFEEQFFSYIHKTYTKTD